MDNLQTISFITSLTSSLLYGTYKSYMFCKRHIKKNIFFVLMSSTQGIQELINDTDHHQNIIPVVVEDVLENYPTEEQCEELLRLKKNNRILYNIQVLRYLKAYLKELKGYNKRSVFVIFTSDTDLLNKYKVDNSRVCVLLPSIKYNHKIQTRLEDDEQVLNLERREKLYNEKYDKLSFNNKDELKAFLSKLLNPLKK